jgi:polyisoprenoid-binding protein YceI
MPKWEFEPGHTQIEFRCRHMMVAWVSGFYKNLSGEVEFDPENRAAGSVDVEIPSASFWSGEEERDAHLRTADFLDVETHPAIRFRSADVRQVAPHELVVSGELTIRGVTRPIELEVVYHGPWETPYWVGDRDEGPMLRIGFTAKTKINRHDFGVSWQSHLDKGGIVVGNEVFVIVEIEALRKK